MSLSNPSSRRKFLLSSGTALAGSLFLHPIAQALSLVAQPQRKMKLALVGTGVRGLSMWGKEVLEAYPDQVEFVGLCDKNEGRLRLGQAYLGVNCPVFLDFDQMLAQTEVLGKKYWLLSITDTLLTDKNFTNCCMLGKLERSPQWIFIGT